MRTTSLGKAGPTVSALGLGCMGMSPGVYGPSDEAEGIVTLRAALDANPQATPAQLEEAVSGNICRCGTYEQMRHAIALLCKAAGKEA